MITWLNNVEEYFLLATEDEWFAYFLLIELIFLFFVKLFNVFY